MAARAFSFIASTALLALWLAGCAASGVNDGQRVLGELSQAAPAVPARPAVAAAAARLPHRLAVVFERTREPWSDGMTGLMARYELRSNEAWATVYVYDNGEKTVPDGLESSPLRRVMAENLLMAQGNAAEGAAQQIEVQVPGSSRHRCAVGRVAREGRGIVNYGCATGVGDVILKVRLTGFYPPGNADEQKALDLIVAALLTDVTRIVAGFPPMSVGTAPGSGSQPMPQSVPSRRAIRL